MPHIKTSKRPGIMENIHNAVDAGDYNFLFTVAMIKVWTKTPSYKTAIELRKAARQPAAVEEIMEVESQLIIMKIPLEDRIAAREEAFAYFRDRVLINYERKKAEENGDVYAGVPFAETILPPVPVPVEKPLGFLAEAPAAETPIADHDADQEIGVNPVETTAKEEPKNVNNNRNKRKGQGR